MLLLYYLLLCFQGGRKMFGLFSGGLTTELILQYGVRVVIIFLILPVHEYAHAWMAHKMGDDTAYYQGRLTLNPIAHVDIIGAICLLLTGYGWAKPVPINPLRFKKYRAGIALTALAGPVSNIIVAFIAMIVYKCLAYFGNFDYDNQMVWYIFTMISYFISINLGLAVFHLLPLPPLDGSKVLSYFTPAKYEQWLARNAQVVHIIFIVVVFTGLLSIPLSLLSGLLYNLLNFLTMWIDLIAGVI